MVDVPDERVAAVESHWDLVADRLNARSVEVIGSDEGSWDEFRYLGRQTCPCSALI